MPAVGCEEAKRLSILAAPLNEAATRALPLESGLYCISIKGTGRGSESKNVALTAPRSCRYRARRHREGVRQDGVRVGDAPRRWKTTRRSADRAGRSDRQGAREGHHRADGTVQFTQIDIATGAGISDKAFLVIGDGEL